MPKTYAMAHLDVTNAEKFMADYGSKVEAGQYQAILSGRTDNSTNTYLAIVDGLSD